MDPKRLGRWGEDLARQALKAKGYELLEQNVSLGRAGELDLVARDGQVIVFVEIKTRRSGRFGGAILAVGEAKQRRLTRLARLWLQRNGLLDVPARFDVVAVQKGPDGTDVAVIQNAFEALE